MKCDCIQWHIEWLRPGPTCYYRVVSPRERKINTYYMQPLQILAKCLCCRHVEMEDEVNSLVLNQVSNILCVSEQFAEPTVKQHRVGGREINDAPGKPLGRKTGALPETIDTEPRSKHLKCKCLFCSRSASASSALASPRVHFCVVQFTKSIHRGFSESECLHRYADSDALQQGVCSSL